MSSNANAANGSGLATPATAGPPYHPMVQSLGAPPKPIPDVPVSAVFSGLFLIAAMFHLKLFVGNKKMEHKFIFSMAMFVFSMIRVVSTSLRIAWSYDQKNVKLAIATQIFVAAGTVVLYIINLFFTQRLVRARHPHIGWHRPFKLLIPNALAALTVIGIIMVVTVVVQSFYTLDPNTHRIDRDVQLAVLTYFAFVSFVPVPTIVLMLAIPRRTYIDKFGSGRFRTKIVILAFSAALLTLGAGFRCGTAFLTPTPLRAHTPWYVTRACFYCFDFLVELLVVLAYLAVRVDRRFYVPDNVGREGEYSAEVVSEKPSGQETDVFTLNSDGRTLSLPDGRTLSLADKHTWSMADVSSTGHAPGSRRQQRPSLEDAQSRSSSTYVTIKRWSGRYEQHALPSEAHSSSGASEEQRHEMDSGPVEQRAQGSPLAERLAVRELPA